MGILLIVLVISCIWGSTVQAKPPSKIKGGSAANEGEFPWQVSLRINTHHICGGSIIDETHILTAAHCIVTSNLRKETGIAVLVGTNNIHQATQKTYGVKHLHVHEKYTGKRPYQYDIGIIVLNTPIKFNARQKAVALPVKDVPVGDTVTISGWGILDYPPAKSSRPSKLMKMEKKIVSNSHCTNQHRIDITAEHVCAFSKHGQGICSGDSGSGLIYNGKVVGIASWVKPCGLGFPDVYTRVFAFKKWIDSKIASDK